MSGFRFFRSNFIAFFFTISGLNVVLATLYDGFQAQAAQNPHRFSKEIDPTSSQDLSSQIIQDKLMLCQVFTHSLLFQHTVFKEEGLKSDPFSAVSFLGRLAEVRMDREFLDCLPNPEKFSRDPYEALMSIAHTFYENVSPFREGVEYEKDTEGRYLEATDRNHAEVVTHLALKLSHEVLGCDANPQSKKILALAAAFHDIERFSPKVRTEKIPAFDSNFRKLVAHPLKSAQLFLSFLNAYRRTLDESSRIIFDRELNTESLNQVILLILYHDSGRRGVTIKQDGYDNFVLLPPLTEIAPDLVPWLDILAEADARAFWAYSLEFFIHDYNIRLQELPVRLAKCLEKVSIKKEAGHREIYEMVEAEHGDSPTQDNPRAEVTWRVFRSAWTVFQDQKRRGSLAACGLDHGEEAK